MTASVRCGPCAPLPPPSISFCSYSIALAASVAGGCQLGGGTYYLEVHNRTAVPIEMQGGSWAGPNRVIASCESAEFAWGRRTVSNMGASPPPTPPADAVTVEIPSSLSPPAIPVTIGGRS